jgi:hypothetical protein
MLIVTIPAREMFDEKTGTFFTTKKQTLQLEHSLVSISKWESKWHKAFLGKEPKTFAQTIDYIKCMTITQNVDPEVYNHIPKSVLKEIDDYIGAPMTATTFGANIQNGRSEIPTSEVIYYWMIAQNVPMECQKWHLNRLLTLIRVCSIKNAPPKKQSKRDTINQYAALNAARRQKLNTKG